MTVGVTSPLPSRTGGWASKETATVLRSPSSVTPAQMSFSATGWGADCVCIRVNVNVSPLTTGSSSS